jgi:hypothetical protein
MNKKKLSMRMNTIYGKHIAGLNILYCCFRLKKYNLMDTYSTDKIVSKKGIEGCR